MANYHNWQDMEGLRDCARERDASKNSSSDATTAAASDRSDVGTATATDGSDLMIATATDEIDEVLRMESSINLGNDASKKKKSGRSRQRAAKWWASVRCRTPSPETVWR